MNDNINEDNKQTRFTSTNQPKKRRKPSQWKKFVKEYDVSPKDREYMAQVILSVKTKDEMMELMKNSKIPFGIWAACVATMADIKKGGKGFFTYLWDAAYGKLPEKTEITGKLDYTDMTKEDRIKRIKELEEIARARKKEVEEKKDEKT